MFEQAQPKYAELYKQESYIGDGVNCDNIKKTSISW
jgi:hypothetical protein